MGPIAVSPTTDYFATVDINRPEDPDVQIYTVRNTGSTDVDVSVVTVNNDAITFGSGLRTLETTLGAGASFDFGVEVDIPAVRLGRNAGEIRVIADTPGNDQIVPIRAVVLGYAGPPPTTRPANDNFADAIRLSDGRLTMNISTYGSTTQIGEPDHDGEDNGGSIWYAIETGREGPLSISVGARLGQTSLGVYRGNSLAALVSVASASATGGPATLTFNPDEDETYYLAVDYNPIPNSGGNGEQRSVALNITPLAGDHDFFATPMELTGPGGVGALNFAGATGEANEPSATSEDHTLWLRASGTPGEIFDFQIVTSNRFVLFYLYDGDALGSLTDLASGLGSTSSNSEAVRVAIPADGDLYVQLIPGSFGDGQPADTESIFRYSIGAEETASRIATAVAPQFRATRPNTFSTALLAASVSATGEGGRDCGLLPPLGYPGVYRFMPLTPQSGPSGDAVDIAAGTSQIYAFGTQRAAGTDSLGGFPELTLVRTAVTCDNIAASRATSTNTFYLTVSDQPLADIVAVAAITNGNAVSFDPDGATRFAVAAANLSTTGGPVIAIPVAIDNDYENAPTARLSEAVVFGDDIFPTLPLRLEICETDPATGACQEDFASTVQMREFAGGATRTFTVRVIGEGEEIDFLPGSNRIVIGFIQVGSLDQIDPSTMRLVGGSSVAVRTTPTD
ncbi:MAG TPA: hypothetical protein DCQ53_07555 [Alphaproteobacteria bacterium]|nr:hypothetical protein [Alphaproteobacteria bacterium]